MIQLIGISGRMESGKDTAAKVIQELSRPQGSVFYEWEKWEIKKYAGKLKQIASLLTGISVEKFEDQEFKRSYLGSEWKVGETEGGIPIRMTVRLFLQKLGTEALRDGLHTNTWINALYADWKEDSKWIITDCRFRNEFDAIKSRGGKVIYLERGESNGDPHPSETEMMLFKDECDCQIDNNGSLEDLKFLLQVFLSENNLLHI